MNQRDGVEFSGRERTIDIFVVDVFSQSTWSGSAFFPQRRATSSHLSENAPHIQQSTPRSTRLRIDASITPQADDVERNTGCLVPKSVCSLG